jgi:hypothetical protein
MGVLFLRFSLDCSKGLFSPNTFYKLIPFADRKKRKIIARTPFSHSNENAQIRFGKKDFPFQRLTSMPLGELK